MSADSSQVARDQWARYTYCRDMGHLDFLHKVYKCEKYFEGLQWDPLVLQALREQRRPGLTINKVLGTIANMLGEQIDLRTDIAFKAMYGAPSGNSDILTKVFRFISDHNQLIWRRSEMFADGAIGSRGYLDVRMNYDTSLAGNVEISNVMNRNVIPDPDAQEYDPDEWNDVIVTKWMSPDDIEMMYNKEVADALRVRTTSSFECGFDSIDVMSEVERSSFGSDQKESVYTDVNMSALNRYVRVIDRQHRVLAKKKFFVDLKTYDKKEIPESWDRDRIAATLQISPGITVDESIGKKIMWTCTADEYELHNQTSPYQHFTIVPYFPFLRYGKTIGFVENLIDPQDLLNKTTSQELHVINTTANSGWITKQGNLKNMQPDELEQNGARTGLVIEVEDLAQIEKITPNQIPQGLSELSRKGENYIKAVSMRGDAQTGMTRADVSADQIEANNAASDRSMRKPLDNLNRSDFILARNVKDLIQEFYSDPRIMSITHNDLTGEQEDIKINFPDPETGEIMNDVTLGEYTVSVISQPHKESLEDSQFEQAAYMKEKLGIPIPSEVLVENSRLINKTQLVAAIKEQEQGQAAQMQKQMEVMGKQLELANLKAETSKTEADGVLKRSKAAESLAKMQQEAQGDPKAQAEMELEKQKAEQEMALAQQKHEQDMQIQREKAQLEMQIKQQQSQEDARLKRAQAIMAMRQQAAQPAGKQKEAA